MSRKALYKWCPFTFTSQDHQNGWAYWQVVAFIACVFCQQGEICNPTPIMVPLVQPLQNTHIHPGNPCVSVSVGRSPREGKPVMRGVCGWCVWDHGCCWYGDYCVTPNPAGARADSQVVAASALGCITDTIGGTLPFRRTHTLPTHAQTQIYAHIYKL